MKILLIGHYGQVGAELLRLLPALGEVTAVDRDSCDLTQPTQVRETVQRASPQVIVNVAAYTAVDQAESEPELAMAINGTACELLAAEARRSGAALIHYSTDYVYDGRKPVPYVETDAVNPLSVYGRTKLAGEEAIVASGVPHLILRTSWVYGLHGRNFLLTMVRLAREKPELRVVADQFGVPNWAVELARATTRVIGVAAGRAGTVQDAIGENSGVFHLSSTGRASWHEFASAIVDTLSKRGLVPAVPVRPIATRDYPTPAARPANSVLDGSRLRTVWDTQLPDWKRSLAECLDAFAG
jgi:dTDP-4-dehydrorhamnose reductase